MGGTVGSTTWSANTANERHMIVFKASLSGGAALDPCFDTTSCRIEPSNDYRAAASIFWQDPRRLAYWAGPSADDATTCYEGVTGPTSEVMDYPTGATCPTSQGNEPTPVNETQADETPVESSSSDSVSDEAVIGLVLGIAAIILVLVVLALVLNNKKGETYA